MNDEAEHDETLEEFWTWACSGAPLSKEDRYTLLGMALVGGSMEAERREGVGIIGTSLDVCQGEASDGNV